MDDNSYAEKKPFSIIQEIEGQLENYLRRQREEIEKALDEKIQKERELARQQLARIEEEVKKEWSTLEEYARNWGQLEEEGNSLLARINDCLQRIINRQVEIEKLARDTAEDIKILHDLEEKLEEIRKKSQEQAGLVSRRLEERFGLKTSLLAEKQEVPYFMDLSPELEKLKKIKELLTLEQKSYTEELLSPDDVQAQEGSELAGSLLEKEEKGIKETEPDKPKETFLEDKLAKEIKRGLIEKMVSTTGSEAELKEAAGEKKEFLSQRKTGRELLEPYYHEEQANGSGEIGYYQKESKIILEAGDLLNRLKSTIEEAKKLSFKLSFIKNKKEEFFLKQEIVRYQETLRRYLQRILLLVEKEGFRFPAITQDLINRHTIEDLAELLRVQNWGTGQDLDYFKKEVISLLVAFKNRTTPENLYYAAIKKELEA
ncbi:MAG: hypothetical protein H5U07_02580 [Candidatus Aminicenantes bacterium]|nr:hypothetical protein [Candidatus Aminicenantes bacterium]